MLIRLILSFIFCNIFIFAGAAQVQQNDTDQTEAADTVVNTVEERLSVPKSFYIPTGLRLGVDVAGVGMSVFHNKRNRYEVQGDIDFHRFYFAGSYGVADFEIEEAEFNYSNSGNFFRIGVDANFLKFDPDFNTLTFGIRYAQANFSENLSTRLEDPVYGFYSEDLSNPEVTARWFELTTGLRVMLLDNLYTGYTFRIALNRKVSGVNNEFGTYDIPGFGLSQFKNRWNFNYYVVYRIAWKEKKMMIPAK